MRNFEQRLGEIRRRGEELKRKRRNRNKLLALCAPLVLCAGLCAVLLPQFKSVPGDVENVSPGGTPEVETRPAMTPPQTVQQIRVEGPQWGTTHTDAAAVTQITQLLGEITNKKQSSYYGPIIDPAQASDDPAYTGAGGVLKETTGYIVTVTAGEEIRQYCLLGSALQDLQSGETYGMDEKELFALKDALGIPFY